MNADDSRPVRIAHLVPFPVEYYVPLYRQLAQRDDVDLTVYFYSDATTREFYDSEFARTIEWDIPLLDGYRYEFLPSSRRIGMSGNRFLRRPNWDVIRAVARGRYDIIWIHGYSHLTSWLAVLAARPFGARLLLRDAQNLLHPRPFHKRLLKRAALAFLYRLGAGAYVGEQSRRYFRFYGMPEERLFPVLHCVDDPFFRRRDAELRPRRAEVRRSFGIVDDAPVILFVGKLIDCKQPLDLVDAYARVAARQPCWLLVVGDGPLREAIETRVRDEGIEGVRLAGFVNQAELPSAYVAADVFVLPSSYEVWGMVVNEAMNHGLPLVLSDHVGSAVDLVREGWNGFVFPAGDVVALAEALGSLVRNLDKRREFGYNSLRLAETYGVGRTAAALALAARATARRFGAERARPTASEEAA